jgi:ribosomal protein S18 acetylase RimI-like enzyme
VFRRNRIGFSLLHNAYMAGGRRLSVAAFNEPAIRFYEMCGWTRVFAFSKSVVGTEIATLLMRRG